MVMSDQNWHDLGLEELWQKLHEEEIKTKENTGSFDTLNVETKQENQNGFNGK